MARKLKHRAVIEIKGSQGVAQGPEMQELTRVYGTMTDEEKQRTVDYLKGSGAEDEQKGGIMSNDELLTTREAAVFLKLSTITLAKWRALRKGPTWTRTGRTVKHRRKDLEAYLRKNAVSN